jgi:hypothetical protein
MNITWIVISALLFVGVGGSRCAWLGVAYAASGVKTHRLSGLRALAAWPLGVATGTVAALLCVIEYRAFAYQVFSRFADSLAYGYTSAADVIGLGVIVVAGLVVAGLGGFVFLVVADLIDAKMTGLTYDVSPTWFDLILSTLLIFPLAGSIALAATGS